MLTGSYQGGTVSQPSPWLCIIVHIYPKDNKHIETYISMDKKFYPECREHCGENNFKFSFRSYVQAYLVRMSP
jgi:hypothetical protein